MYIEKRISYERIEVVKCDYVENILQKYIFSEVFESSALCFKAFIDKIRLHFIYSKKREFHEYNIESQ